MVTAGILPFRENSHGRTGNRTRVLMISSQRLWPLDHEAGLVLLNFISPFGCCILSPIYDEGLEQMLHLPLVSINHIISALKLPYSKIMNCLVFNKGLTFWCMFVRASLYMRREEDQLDATEWFIALVICSTCFGHLYVHHQEIQSSSFPHPGRVASCSAPNSRPPATKALQTIYGNNTSIVSSSLWWTCMCPKYVEQITIAVYPSVVSSWFSSLRTTTKKWSEIGCYSCSLAITIVSFRSYSQ